MNKKITATMVLAVFTSEAVLIEQHEHSWPHAETGVKLPKKLTATAMSSGTGNARSATVTLIPNKQSPPDQPHIEPTGDGPSATGLDINQIS